ncbi:hypothetical protein F4811DRAFT_547057 [Daldinia bambusicola]|nr:hypothetical protein F4811DRAFT_547057 [Daldinia bambusicola]
MSSSSPPPREPNSRTPRPPDEDPPRRKRYSLIVEILDDDSFEVLERHQQQRREGADRPRSRRLSRATSTSRHRHSGGSSRQQHNPDASTHSRRTSTPPNVADAGSRDRASERSHHTGTGSRSRTSRASSHGHEEDVYETAAEANPHQNAISPGQQQQPRQAAEEAALPSPSPSPAHQRQRSPTHTSSTQTRIRGYGPHSVFTSPYNLFRPRHPDQSDLDAMEAAYRDGFRLGRRFAGLYDHRLYPRRPIGGSPARILEDREWFGADDRRRQRREDYEQRGWRCFLPPWLFGRARRGPPAGGR